MNRLCPECGGYNPPEATACLCGRKLKAVTPPTRFPLYLAVLPLVLPAFFLFNAMTQFTRASSTAGTAQTQRPAKHSCVDTYGITLTPQTKPSPSTLMRGTVSNTCPDALTKIQLKISAADEQGNHEAATVEIDELKSGATQPFEHAWTKPVASWEITSDK